MTVTRKELLNILIRTFVFVSSFAYIPTVKTVSEMFLSSNVSIVLSVLTFFFVWFPIAGYVCTELED